MMTGEGRERGSLDTPGRERSRSRRSETRARLRSRSRSHSRRLMEREVALKRERERVRQMEEDLQKERDAEHRSRRTERLSSPRTSRRSCSRMPRSGVSREPRSRSREHSFRTRRDRAGRGSTSIDHRSKRSCSPTFTSKDIVQIIKSIKDVLPPQPTNQNQISINRGFDHKNIIPEFNPSEKNQRIDVWLKKVNECSKVYGWDEKTVIHFAMQKLSGLAKTWFESLNTILFTWDEWQAKLVNAFPSEQNYGQLLEDMLKRRSRQQEPIEIYFYEKLALLNQCEIVGRRAVDCLIHGIVDKTMRSSALALRCEEPDQLLKFLMSSNKEPSIQFPPARDRNVSGADDKTHNRIGSKVNPNIFCYNCKEKGHIYTRCSKPLLKCSYCQKIGHKSEMCRQKSDAGSTKAETVTKTMRIAEPDRPNPCDKFMKKVTVNGVTLEAFVDLGSEVTLIRESDFLNLRLSHDHLPSMMKGFGNSIVQSLGSAQLDLSVDGVTANVTSRVVSDCFLEKAMLIGQTYSEQPHVVVYKDANKLQFLHVGSELPSMQDPDEEQLERVRFIAHNKIYGAASVRAGTVTKFTGSVVINTKVVGKPPHQYIVCGGVYEIKQGKVFVTIIPCAMICSLEENFVFARAERVQAVFRLSDVDVSLTQSQDLISTAPLVSRLDENQLHLGEGVSESDRVKLIELLKRYDDCFAYDLASLGCTNTTEMKIELSSDRPVVYRPYRLSHHEREKVRMMIDEMLQAGIIRESVSNYASPIILVRKKDGGVRLCVDYRLLNSITIKERYPIPVIEDEISRLAGQAWFITLDLMSGYYQVPISEDSKHLTAFVTPDGQYEYNRMPFGLANAPAVFQRMMNRVLGPARFDKATVYIDDLLIFGKTPLECIERLEEILLSLRKANLKLNLSKCNFLQNKINYLGYEISSAGMRPGEAKIQCVSDFPQPQNVHSVRQFLGLVSYFRKFIPGFAHLAQPITKLLKRDAVWEWGKDQEVAFKALKDKLVNRPVLMIYDPTAETELHTDASKLGVGGILLQRPEGSGSSFHPVAYYSRQTTPEERNFHSYELETLAVVCSLKKLRVYLLGKVFKIVTDCSALRSTFEKRDIIPRIARWWLALQEFTECSVEYRAGSKMGHVDALSRNPIIDAETVCPERYPSVMTISDDDWLLTLQLGDSELCRIRDIVKSDLDPKGLEYIKSNYVLRDNKLFRCIGGDKECLRWVVPKGARWQICKRNHDDIGHVGFEKTLQRIKNTYWFAKMKRFIQKYVGACIDCAYAKKSANTCEGLLHPIEKIGRPFHTLHMDHLGPFVRSKSGNTYLLNIVDAFTKFLFIKPVKNTKTQNVIKSLQDIFDTFRAPERIISDRGSCFTSHAFKKFCLDRGIQHVLNAVASPRSNGQVERYNRTILDSLTAQNIRANEKEWDKDLGRIQWGLNNTVQKTIGRSPAEVMFGAEMISEYNPILNELSNEAQTESSLTAIRSEVKFRIDKAQDEQKRRYDQGRRPARSYDYGDLVKITKVMFQNNGKSTKLLPSYEGPYKVVKVLGNDRYKVAPIAGYEGMKNRRKTTVAADRMQPWIHIASLQIADDSDNDVSYNTNDGDESES
jgi:hypothetical protein